MAARNYYVAPLLPMNYGDGTAFTSAVTLTDISPTVPSGSQRYVAAGVAEPGTILRLRAHLNYTSTSVTPTLTLGFYYGGVAGTVIAALAGIAISASAVAWPAIMEYEGEFRAVGAAGQLKGQGRLYWPASLTSFSSPVAGTLSPFALPATAAARLTAATLNTNNQNAVTVGALWSSATGTPSITCEHLCAELVG